MDIGNWVVDNGVFPDVFPSGDGSVAIPIMNAHDILVPYDCLRWFGHLNEAASRWYIPRHTGPARSYGLPATKWNLCATGREVRTTWGSTRTPPMRQFKNDNSRPTQVGEFEINATGIIHIACPFVGKQTALCIRIGFDALYGSPKTIRSSRIGKPDTYQGQCEQAKRAICHDGLNPKILFLNVDARGIVREGAIIGLVFTVVIGFLLFLAVKTDGSNRKDEGHPDKE